MIIRVMTFNIQHALDFINKKIDIALMADVIKKSGAEIICLNEVYEGQEKEIAEILNFESYFGKSFIYKNRGYGNAILSKYPVKEVKVIPIPDPDEKNEDIYYETRSIMQAEFKDLDFFLFASHFGLAQSEQRNAVETCIKLFSRCNKPYLLLGDLNMEPSDIKLTPFFALMKDAASEFNIKAKTYPSVNPCKKIDYIFFSPPFKILKAEILELVASDHFPHVADFLIK